MLFKSPDNLERYLVELVQAQGMIGSFEHAYAARAVAHQQACVTAFHEFSGYLDEAFAASDAVMLAHDVRIHCEAGRAHIDHLVITRFLDVFLIESRIEGDQLIINEQEEFAQRYNDGTTIFVRSPVNQLRRNLIVMQHVLRSIDVPGKLGQAITPHFHRFVAIPPTTRLDNQSPIRNEYFLKPAEIVARIQSAARRGPVLSLLRALSSQQLSDLAKIVVRWHTPDKVDFIGKYRVVPA
ncbi:MAG TPA: nuclease-related domain-containing protein [Burkholderiaceae bacterium]|nr:nuclease-related domain-containing protein [Burkholderiaceae bacterium]